MSLLYAILALCACLPMSHIAVLVLVIIDISVMARLYNKKRLAGMYLDVVGRFVAADILSGKDLVPLFVENVQGDLLSGWYLDESGNSIRASARGDDIRRLQSYDALFQVSKGHKVLVILGNRRGTLDTVAARIGRRVVLESKTIVRHWEIVKFPARRIS